MGKMACVHVVEQCSVTKGKKALPFSMTQMVLEGTVLGKVGQIEKDKYCVISLICGI